MRWIAGLFSVVGIALVGATVGCQAPAPATAQPPIVAPASVDKLGLQLSESRLEQQRLAGETEKLRDDLYRTALALKQIKDRLEEVAVYSATNAAKMVAIEKQIRETRKRVGEGGGAEAHVLRSSLEREQQDQERLRALLAERDKEVRSLREAVDAQKSAFDESRSVPAPSAVPAPADAVTPSPSPEASSTSSVYRMVADGHRALRSGELAKAQRLFEDALKQQPDLTGAQLGLAVVAYQADNLSEARRLLGVVLAADKKNAQAIGLRGLISWRDGFLKEGVRDCARAVELDPADPLLRKFYGITLNARGQTDHAIREMRKAVELDPADAEAKLNLAILLATGDSPKLDEARTLYQQALAAGAVRDTTLDKILARGTPGAP